MRSLLAFPLAFSLLGVAACGSDHSGTKTPTGPTLLLSGTYALYGQTTSGMLIAGDASFAISGIDEKTGKTTPIAPKGDGGVQIVGDVVIVAHDVDQTTFNGGLGVWTAATGYHDLGAKASNAYAVSTDGTHVAYFDNIDSSTQVGDLIIDTIEHAGAKTLFTQQMYNYQPLVVAGKVVVGHGAASDMGYGTVTSYDLTTGAAVDLSTSAYIYYSQNAQGNAIAVTAKTGGNILFDFKTGDMVTLPLEVTNATFSADGTSLLGVTSTQGLEIVHWSGTMATADPPLLTSGVGGVYMPSGDGKYATYYTSFDDTTFTTDLSIVNLSAPATSKQLVASGVGGGSFFSTDSSYVTYETNVDQTTFAGTVNLAPVATDSSTMIATTVEYTTFLAGAQMLLIDNVTSGSFYEADVLLVNPSGTTAPMATKLFTQIDPGIQISLDKKTLYYSINNDVAKNGIYRMPAP